MALLYSRQPELQQNNHVCPIADSTQYKRWNIFVTRISHRPPG